MTWSPRLEFPAWRWAKNFEWISRTQYDVSTKHVALVSQKLSSFDLLSVKPKSRVGRWCWETVKGENCFATLVSTQKGTKLNSSQTGLADSITFGWHQISQMKWILSPIQNLMFPQIQVGKIHAPHVSSVEHYWTVPKRRQLLFSGEINNPYEDGDNDIYIMMKCVSVCNEKWALPPGSLL